MKTVDVTFQNLDSSEISLTDVSLALSQTLTKARTLTPPRGCCWPPRWALCLLASSAPVSTRADETNGMPLMCDSHT